MDKERHDEHREDRIMRTLADNRIRYRWEQGRLLACDEHILFGRLIETWRDTSAWTTHDLLAFLKLTKPV